MGTNYLLKIPINNKLGYSHIEDYYSEVEYILSNNSEIVDNKINNAIKRVFDIIFSLLLLPFVLPIIFIIAILIKLDSSGSSIFVQKRFGKNFKKFNCYKFRTMYINSDNVFHSYIENNKDAFDEWKNYKKLRNHDPRITKIGGFLRKTSLDELPQIFNVLKGEMSLIGPRPYFLEEEKDMHPYINSILLITPGLTGLWQVSGRNKLTFSERLKLDCWYVSNHNILLDIFILIKTIKVVFMREGAY